jgi:hypothetical protein
MWASSSKSTRTTSWCTERDANDPSPVKTYFIPRAEVTRDDLDWRLPSSAADAPWQRWRNEPAQSRSSVTDPVGEVLPKAQRRAALERLATRIRRARNPEGRP